MVRSKHSSWGLAALAVAVASLLASQVSAQHSLETFRDIHKRSNELGLPTPRAMKPVSKRSALLQNRGLFTENLKPRTSAAMTFGEGEHLPMPYT
jgi:hypothetical protein